eukprot:gene6597-biopygen11908
MNSAPPAVCPLCQTPFRGVGTRTARGSRSASGMPPVPNACPRGRHPQGPREQLSERYAPCAKRLSAG